MTFPFIDKAIEFCARSIPLRAAGITGLIFLGLYAVYQGLSYAFEKDRLADKVMKEENAIQSYQDKLTKPNDPYPQYREEYETKLRNLEAQFTIDSARLHTLDNQSFFEVLKPFN